jgi:CheY-like chemotaxis protein
MDKETLDKIFDPFFTTKGASGTGLGLAVVFGIVNDHNAAIDVYSEPGEGTRFSIYFPVSEGGPARPPSGDKDDGKDYKGSRQKILVVEDDPQTRELAVKILKNNNYVVSEAKDIDGAVKKYKENEGNYDLIFSDMILPGGDGLELFRKLKKIKPPRKVLFTSGYLDGESRWDEIKAKKIPFIGKPYGVRDLLEKIQQILFDNPA